MRHIGIVALAGLVTLAGQAPVWAKWPPPTGPAESNIRVEMRGTLSALWKRVGPFSFHLEVDGTTYHLELPDAELRQTAERLDGHRVVVTGWLKGQAVLVEGLRPEDGSLVFTPVKIKGKIAENFDLKTLGSPARFVWEVTANGRKFELDFSADPLLLEMARLFRGKTVVVSGRMSEFLDNPFLELARVAKTPFPPCLISPPRVVVTGMAVEPGEDEYVVTTSPPEPWIIPESPGLRPVPLHQPERKS